MKNYTKTIILGIVTLCLIAALVISPPIPKSYASRGGHNLGYAAAGAALGACAAYQYEKDKRKEAYYQGMAYEREEQRKREMEERQRELEEKNRQLEERLRELENKRR